MKKLFLSGLLLCLAINCLSQSYELGSGEYFIDNDPGIGSGIAISAFTAADSTNQTLNISTTGLSAGFHRVYIRYRDTSGHWGNTRNYFFNVKDTSTANVVIAGGEYFVDTDPGPGNGTAIGSFSAADSVNQYINVSTVGLSVGFHRVYVRYLNGMGQWGNTRNYVFSVLDTSALNLQIAGGEYFIDTDPGIGSGTPLTSFPAADSVNQTLNISSTGLSPGFHRVFIRYQYATGQWGNTRNYLFNVIGSGTTTDTTIVAGEYFVDTDPGIGSGTPIGSLSAADSVNQTINISSTGLTDGYHIAYVRYLDARGHWGNTRNYTFQVFDSSRLISPPITAGEYFVDTDPGVGYGTAFTVISGDTVTNSVAVSTGALSLGFHRAYFRYQDSIGKWSITSDQLFYVIDTTHTGMTPPAPPIAAGEYFVDTDPGVGNGTAFTVISGDTATNSVSVSTSALSIGFHRAYFRYQDSTGKWSITDNQLFYILDTAHTGVTPLAPPITVGEYFVDTDPGVGNGTSFTASGGDSSTNNISISTTSLTAGGHTAFFRYMDSTGKWGQTQSGEFYVCIQPIGAITGATNTTCPGGMIAFSDTTAGSSHTWSSSNNAVATVNTSGVVTGIAAGNATISYTVTVSCGTVSVITTINVLPNLIAGSITGASTICAGASTTLSDTASGGTWHSSNTGVATVNSSGQVMGIGGGSALISYTVSNTCGSSTATFMETVDPLPSTPAAITGTLNVCVGGSTTLSDATGGGAWSSSNTAVATVGTGGSLTGVTAGIDTITYTETNSCGSSKATAVVTVVPNPATPAAITGTNELCAGTTTSLHDSTGGGTWSSNNPAAGTVGSSGLVTGIAAGNTTISYTIANSCGSNSAIAAITVNASPAPITGVLTICAGSDTTLADTSGGGAWSSSNTAVGSVNSSGVVSGLLAGTTVISYTIGSCAATTTFTVDALPVAGSVTGTTTFCQGTTTTLADTAPAGDWSSSDIAVATIGSAGVVYGVSSGTATISYSVTNSCGTAYATAIITVNPLPGTPPLIEGTTTVCTGASVTLSDSVSGGTWESSNAGIASINGSGIVTGNSGGMATISYTIGNSCGSAMTTTTVNVIPSVPAAITGTVAFCKGATITLHDATSGGAWSSSNTAVATVDTSGQVTGIGGGSAYITYTITNYCGTSYTTHTVIVDTVLATAGTISGPATVCPGGSITLTATLTGGSWIASNSNATVYGTGVVDGITAGAIDTITYSLSNTCNTVTTSTVITVTALPVAGTIVCADTVCLGAHTLLTDSLGIGATFSYSTPGIVYITNILGGNYDVEGTSAGVTTITLTVGNGCGATASTTKSIVVAPYAGAISGPTSVTAGASAPLSETVSGGTWSSGNTSIATINSSTGIVTGVTLGATTMSYTVTGSCGTATATFAFSVGYCIPDHDSAYASLTSGSIIGKFVFAGLITC